MAATILASVTTEPIDGNAVIESTLRPQAGATTHFLGVVRDHDGGRSVIRLEYEPHPQAQRRIEELARDVAQRHASVLALAVHHRSGTLRIGDIALAAAVSTAHRGAAFDALRDLVETVKHELPIWKHQFFDDGSDEWVNSA